MSSNLYVYVGPCIRVYPNGANEYNFKAIDDYILHDEERGRILHFGLVVSGCSEDKMYLLPNVDSNRPNRICEWDKYSDILPLENPDPQAELEAFRKAITEPPPFAHSIVWAIVPYFY